MELVSIGAFARMSKLSQKALRLYDELGLLVPARVDPDSGYRYYDPAQLEQARLVAALRAIGVPLAQVTQIVRLDSHDAAERVRAYWATIEIDHVARRQLAEHLLGRLTGTRSVMYEVHTREIPERSILCLKRNVESQQAVWDLGKHFIGILKRRPVPRIDGRAGGFFLIYYGEVSDDSDGPVECCFPVPSAEVEELAGHYPELTLRIEPAHEEAFVSFGTEQASEAQWQLAGASLHDWAVEHRREPSDLGVRVTHYAEPPVTAESVPDRDFAVPLV